MTEFLNRLTSYNLFNYLFPGAVFVFMLRGFDVYEFSSDNIIVEFFIYYFAGMTVSRFGSVLIEPAFQWLRIVRYAPYNEYLKAVDSDPKIALLLEENNAYRTIVAVFVCALLVAVAVAIADYLDIPNEIVAMVFASIVTLLYVIAYRKQTTYIRKRVAYQQTREDVNR